MNINSERSTQSDFYSIFEEENPYITPPDYRSLLNQEAIELIEEEFDKLKALDTQELLEELETYKPIVNFKFGSKLNYTELGFNQEFSTFLEPVLKFIAALKVKEMGSPMDNKTPQEMFSILKLLVYRSLLLPVNKEEAFSVMMSLAYVLSLREENACKEVSAYIFRQFLSK